MFTNTSIYYLATTTSTHIVDSYYFAQRPSRPIQILLNTRGLLYITLLLRLFCCFLFGHSARHPYNPSHEPAIQYSHHNPDIYADQLHVEL